jgi:hypothetical protein
MLHFIATSSLEGRDPLWRLGFVHCDNDDDIQRCCAHDVQEPTRRRPTTDPAARAALVIRVILNDLAAQEDFADSIIGYVFRYHLLVTVDSQADLVCGRLETKSGNDLCLISVPCVFHVIPNTTKILL